MNILAINNLDLPIPEKVSFWGQYFSQIAENWYILIAVAVFAIITITLVAIKDNFPLKETVITASLGPIITVFLISLILPLAVSHDQVNRDNSNDRQDKISELALENVNEVYNLNEDYINYISYDWKKTADVENAFSSEYIDNQKLNKIVIDYNDLSKASNYKLNFAFNDSHEPILLTNEFVTKEMIQEFKK